MELLRSFQEDQMTTLIITKVLFGSNILCIPSFYLPKATLWLSHKLLGSNLAEAENTTFPLHVCEQILLLAPHSATPFGLFQSKFKFLLFLPMYILVIMRWLWLFLCQLFSLSFFFFCPVVGVVKGRRENVVVSSHHHPPDCCSHLEVVWF